MTTYTRLAADHTPTDTDHVIVRVENSLLAQPILVTAHFAPKTMTWKQARKWAESLDIGGFAWRLPTVEEAFFLPDRTKYPALDPEVFIGANDRYPWIWTDTEAASPSGYAWGVSLGIGLSNRDGQDFRNRVLAVRAGQ